MMTIEEQRQVKEFVRKNSITSASGVRIPPGAILRERAKSAANLTQEQRDAILKIAKWQSNLGFARAIIMMSLLLGGCIALGIMSD